ncbi:hypothetical protein ANAPRD1_00590 [Anaplasma phagocytophilum]|nr:hypothetical protein ANAPRD1_00590 [Anaplasma phagocytophilum]SCV66022.1 hypothetical protein ANAPH2_01455 [Anaplasma phagocytophilum]
MGVCTCFPDVSYLHLDCVGVHVCTQLVVVFT